MPETFLTKPVIKEPKTLCLELKHKPNIELKHLQGMISSTQLWFARHLADYLSIGIYNDIQDQKTLINANTDAVLEPQFFDPTKRWATPIAPDIYIPATDYYPAYAVEVDSFWHDSPEQKERDKFKDEVLSRFYGIKVLRHRIVIPTSLIYCKIKNKKNHEYVKNRYQQVFLKQEAEKVAEIILPF